MYTSVKQYQILQPLKRKTSLVKRGSILGNRRVAGLKRSVNSIIRKSGIVDSMIIPEDFYPAIVSTPPPFFFHTIQIEYAYMTFFFFPRSNQEQV